MTFRQLALSSIRGSALRYAAFFLSSVFSVMLFFMYAQFLLHPDLASGYLYGGSATRTVLLVCEVLVAVFAFFFVLYSSGAFLRARNREFGLLVLLGTTRGQLRRLIWLENTLLSATAIVVGIALGQLFSKLFLLGIGRVLGLAEPIRFLFVPSAVLLTAAGFLVLFQLVSAVSTLRLGRLNVAELMHEARKPSTPPRASVWLALLGALLVLAGYGVALTVDGVGVLAAFIPVVTAVVVGTYLLFGHGSVKLLDLARRLEGRYLSGTNMLVVSQLRFRVRDNARLLAAIATLSAVVLAAAGAFYIVTRQFAEGSATAYPFAVTLVESETAPSATVAESWAPFTHEMVDEVLGEHGVTPTLRSATVLYETELRSADAPTEATVKLVPESAFQALVASTGLQPEQGTATKTVGYVNGGLVLGSAGGVVIREVTLAVGAPAPFMWDWYVMADADLAVLEATDAQLERVTLWLYDWPDSMALAPMTQQFYAMGSASSPAVVSGRLLITSMVRETLGLSMFAGLFVSVLFFIGAGSLIYFKLFTELEGDRRLHGRLRRIGITPAESARTVTAQIATIFLLPFALGGVHALVALEALGAMFALNVTQYSLLVVGLFAAVQFGYFLLTRVTYLRALRLAR